ncbi:hypothetical protein [Abyssogena phaseoliformis symbiont]|uniref:hypothetical protein n=1 Tax=Abyssogena phaseoliformis symbiont TaxID=596095 RepID=UPI001915EA44|nr:hypothetical protein [Abyssogena phaseoliformis symbiont]
MEIAAINAQSFFSDQGVTKKQFLEHFSVKGLVLAYKKYQETIVKALVELLTKNIKFIEAAKKSDWFYAGGFYWGIKSINEETQNLLLQSKVKLVKKVQDLDKEINSDCSILEVLDWGVSCSSPWEDYLFLANGYPANALKYIYLSTEFFNKNILSVIEKERFEKQNWLEVVTDLDRGEGVGSKSNDKNLLNEVVDSVINTFA